MAVWHGSAGGIRLQRINGERVYDRIRPADVAPTRNRFGFVSDLSSLITGDRVWLRRIEENGGLSTQPLDMVAGNTAPDVQKYVHVDAVGGVALFETWALAVEGRNINAIPLATPSSDYRISIDVTNREDDRCIAQVTKFTLSTTRTVEDVTTVGVGFRELASTLTGGVGTVELLWDVGQGWPCEGVGDSVEKAAMLHRLALRQQSGGSFRGIFLLKREFEQPLDVVLSDEYASRELFYEADCQILSAQATVDVNDMIRSSIEFQTTGPVLLKYSTPISALLLEPPGTDRLLTEGDEPVLLEFLD